MVLTLFEMSINYTAHQVVGISFGTDSFQKDMWLGRINPLGDPRWESVRTVLRRVITVGLPRKNRAVQDDARTMMRQFDRTWSALDIVVKDSQERRDQPEKAFATYLKQNPDFAAIWGYAVISFTPNEYRSDLVATAQQVGPPDNVLKAMERLVEMKEEGNAKAMEEVKKFDPENELTPLSFRADYARVWYAYHGPCPLHGYVLYHKAIGTPSPEKTLEYYKSSSVTHFVNRFCPNDKNTPE